MATSSKRAALSALIALLLSAASLAAQDQISRFDWDIISLEQNNNRFNGSVLSGFHSVRSPGVTPTGAWKTGLGVLYSFEEQTSGSGSRLESFEAERWILNPKINYGFLERFEAGLGVEFLHADGVEVERSGGVERSVRESTLAVNAAVGGLKWNFYRDTRLRLAAAFDARVATRGREFGTLPGTVYNIEIDGDYAITNRFSMVSNLQFMTSEKRFVSDQVIFDIAGNYDFTDRFRGMLFSTVQEDDEADDAVFYLGFAGQYAVEQHSFTVAFDFQLNDARREVRTESQIDVELSYTFTF